MGHSQASVTPKRDTFVTGLFNRFLQGIARTAPGATSVRIFLHRLRGVTIGKGVWIGYDAILETSYPWLIRIEDGASIGIRSILIAHFRELRGITIERDAVVGPGAIIMPNVTIGCGAVVTAGSVVTSSVPPMTVVQGNPAKVIAKAGIPLKMGTKLREFSRNLKPVRQRD